MTPKESGPIDPTLDSALQSLKERVLGQGLVTEYLQTLRSGTLGLVFAGGGGKGAYEGGVLLALYDCGLSGFEAIAGTSVGALNAAVAHQLFRTGDRSIVARLWADVSPSRVLTWSAFRTPAGLWVRLALFICAIPVVAATRLTILLEGRSRSIRWSGVLHWLGQSSALIPFAIATIMSASILVAVNGWPPDFGRSVNISLGVVLAAGALFGARNFIGRHLSLASNAPLQEMIRRSLELDSLRATKPPVYCTMAAETSWWDPLEASRWSHVSDGAWRRGRAPVYVDLAQAQTNEEAVEWLVQTAALPEVFPRKAIGGRYTVDGGVVDNVPIYPVAMHHPDRIFVIYLDHKLARKEGFYTSEAARCWSMAEFIALSKLDTRQKANAVRHALIERNGPIGTKKPHVVALEPRLLISEQFLPIVPSQFLGNLLTGTLNFSATKARRLLSLGYGDTLVWIENKARDDRESRTRERAASDTVMG